MADVPDIGDTAAAPQFAQNDDGTIRQHDLDKMIEADRYVQGKKPVDTKCRGLRFNKIIHK